MNKHFMEIRRHYDEFHRFLLRKGRLPMKDTGIGYWGISPLNEVFEILTAARLERYKSFIDLGSGDGRVVMLASLFTKAEGIEADPWLHSVAMRIKERLSTIPGIKNAKLHQKDFMGHDLSRYDLLFIHPDKPLYRGLEPKLRNEMRGNLLGYGHHRHPHSLKKEWGFQSGMGVATIYANPLNK